MAYNANIPQPGDQISQSQADILANFQAVNTLVAIDHASFNTADAGKHNKITFPALIGAPAAMAATEIGLYNLVPTVAPLTGEDELFVRLVKGGVTEDIPFTSRLAAVNGWTYLPSGIILQWGSATAPGATSPSNHNLPIAFPNAFLSITGTPNATPAGSNQDIIMAISVVNLTSFRVTRKTLLGTACSFNYLAIGY